MNIFIEIITEILADWTQNILKDTRLWLHSDYFRTTNSFQCSKSMTVSCHTIMKDNKRITSKRSRKKISTQHSFMMKTLPKLSSANIISNGDFDG